LDIVQNSSVGPTEELSLRVSVATLARVVFPNPGDGRLMLALEHKSTLLSAEGTPRLVVKAQPFGGAVRFLNLTRLQSLIEHFHFDSERSRSEMDCRIYIQPTDWETVREYCLFHLNQEGDADIESSPVRELVEEFHDALGIHLQPDQYKVKPAWTVLENEPTPTMNVRASGLPTVRIYRLSKVQISDPTLCQAMVANSEVHSSQTLRDLALADAQKGGRGRANAVLVASMERIRQAYLALPPQKRGLPLPFQDSYLDGNVAAVLDGLDMPKYRYLYG
jgi:hypothetical protein